jgi:hypothetical protein
VGQAIAFVAGSPAANRAAHPAVCGRDQRGRAKAAIGGMPRKPRSQAALAVGKKCEAVSKTYNEEYDFQRFVVFRGVNVNLEVVEKPVPP